MELVSVWSFFTDRFFQWGISILWTKALHSCTVERPSQADLEPGTFFFFTFFDAGKEGKRMLMQVLLAQCFLLSQLKFEVLELRPNVDAKSI